MRVKRDDICRVYCQMEAGHELEVILISFLQCVIINLSLFSLAWPLSAYRAEERYSLLKVGCLISATFCVALLLFLGGHCRTCELCFQ